MTETTPAIEVWFIALDEVDPLVLDRVLSVPLVRDGDPNMFGAGLDIEERRKNIAHAALRVLLARRVGLAAALRPFGKGFAGKPFIDGLAESSAIDFSLSHTGDVALVGIASNCVVGVDIERPRRISMSEDRRRQVMAAGVEIARSPLPEAGMTDAALLAAWVRLEACSKATGDGIGRLFTRLGIVGQKQEIATLAASVAAEPPLAVHDLDLPSPFFGAVASSLPTVKPSIARFPVGEGALVALLQALAVRE